MSDETLNLPVPSGSRRNFVRNLGLASAAAGIVATTGITADAQTATPSDTDILNFALNLEYLEAEFYTYATTGMGIGSLGLTVSGSGSAGSTTGGAQVPFSDPAVARVANELARNERYHVALLQNTITSLGGTPIAKPAINLAVLGNVFANDAIFLTQARAFEEIGVTAYGGAAPLITNKTVVGYAARILATEAEHVGYIRSLIVAKGIPISALDSVDVVPPPSGVLYFSTNSQAITAVRSPGQVLYVAFGGTASATSGGFFPSGVNGSLNAASATPAVTDGVVFYLAPNPIVSQGGLGQTGVYWSCPSTVQYVQVRIGSPTGPLLSTATGVGSAQTGLWVTDGMVFYLLDATYPKNNTPSAATTLATIIARVQ